MYAGMKIESRIATGVLEGECSDEMRGVYIKRT